MHDAHHERGATVETARFLTRVVVLRPLLAVAHRSKPVGSNTAAREVVLHGISPALAERQVVFGRADVAGVPSEYRSKSKCTSSKTTSFTAGRIH